MRRGLYSIMGLLLVITLSISIIGIIEPLTVSLLGATHNIYDIVISLFGICNFIILPFFISSFIFTKRSLMKYFNEGFNQNKKAMVQFFIFEIIIQSLIILTASTILYQNFGKAYNYTP